MPCKWYQGPTHAHVSSGSSGFGLRFDRVTIEFTILGTSAASGARGSWYNITDATTEKKRCSSAIAALGLIHFFRFSFGQSSRVLLSYGLSKMMHGFIWFCSTLSSHARALVRPAAIRRAQGRKASCMQLPSFCAGASGSLAGLLQPLCVMDVMGCRVSLLPSSTSRSSSNGS